MITFNENASKEEHISIVAWDQVFVHVEDEDKFPIKNITLNVPAGDIASVVVERYWNPKDIKDIPKGAILNDSRATDFSTFTERYAVELPEEPINFKIRKMLPESKS